MSSYLGRNYVELLSRCLMLPFHPVSAVEPDTPNISTCVLQCIN